MRQPLVMYPSLDDLSSLPDHDRAIENAEETKRKTQKSFIVQQRWDVSMTLAPRGSLHPEVRNPTGYPVQYVASARRRARRLDSNFEALKKRKREDAVVTSDHVRLAVETAELAAMDIARMRQAIAEHESMLQTGGHASALSR